MNLDELFNSLFKLDNVAVISDEGLFKKSIDNYAGDKFEYLNYEDLYFKNEFDDEMLKEEIVIKQEANNDELFSDIPLKNNLSDIIPEKTANQVNITTVPDKNATVIKKEPTGAILNISDIPCGVEYNDKKEKETAFKPVIKNQIDLLPEIEISIENIIKPEITPLKRLSILYKKLIHQDMLLGGSKYIELSGELLNIFNGLEHKNSRKINLVLDIDNTLLHALPCNPKSKANKDDYIIDFFAEGNRYKLSLALRKGLDIFFKELQYCSNFFINTHGIKFYADEVVKFLNTKYNLNISSNKIVSRDNYGGSTSCKYLHIYSHLNNDKEIKKFVYNAIALDDKPEVWHPLNLCPVLNSKKFLSFCDLFMKDMSKEFFPYSLLLNHKDECNFLELNKYFSGIGSKEFGFVHVENDLSKFSQLEYFTTFIKKVHKFINLLRCKFYIKI
jgi:hypothetical protein